MSDDSDQDPTPPSDPADPPSPDPPSKKDSSGRISESADASISDTKLSMLASGGESPLRRRRRLVFFGIWGAVVVGVLIASRHVLLPFFLAVILAYVFAPIVRWMQAREIRGKSMPRWIAVVLLYLGLLGGLGGLVAFGAPRLAAEIQKLSGELPELVTAVRDDWLPDLERRFRGAMREYSDGTAEPATESGAPDAVTGAMEAPETSLRISPTADGGWAVRLPEQGIEVQPRGESYRIVEVVPRAEQTQDLGATLGDALRIATENTEQTAATLLRTAQTVVRRVVKGVFTFFIMLMLSAYLLITSDRILAFFRSLWPARRRRSFDRLTRRIDRGMRGVIRGQLLIAVVNGVLSGIGFYLFDLRYWPVLTLIATVLSIIPIFGAILSTIPAVIIGLQDGTPTALLVLGWIVLVHQIEANLLNPKIMGDAAKVHPVLVVFALLAGEAIYGIAGALLAVPVLSIVQSLFLHYKDLMLGAGVPRPKTPVPEPAAESA